MITKLYLLTYLNVKEFTSGQWRSAGLSMPGWSNFWFVIRIKQFVSLCKITSIYVQLLRFTI